MAIACNCTDLVNNAACYGPNTLNPKQQKSIIVLSLAAILNVLGGTNYNGALSTTLVTDSVQACCGFDKSRFMAALVNIAATYGTAVDSTNVPAGLDAKLAKVACTQTLDEEQLDREIVFLLCKVAKQLGA